MKQLFLVFLFIHGISSLAHNPNEIGYNFQIDKEKQELTIHFTPKAAIDLIQYIKPELQGQTVIDLEDYVNYLEVYFQKTIKFYLDGQRIDLVLKTSNIYAHDATLLFSLKKIPREYSSFDITIESYTKIYKRVKNIVSVNLDGKVYKRQLEGENRNFGVDSIEEINEANSTIFHSSISVLVLSAFAFIIFKFRKD